MPERTPTALADAFEPTLKDKRGKSTLVCEGEAESVLLAHELQKRGWKARADRAILMPTNDINGEMLLKRCVKVTGRKKGAA